MRVISSDNFGNKAAGICLIAASLGLLLGWIVLMLRTEQGPNLGWFLSHILLLIGAILFIPAILGLRNLAEKAASPTSKIGAGLAMLGAATLVGQFIIDLVIGFVSSTPTEMSALLNQISSTPGVAQVFYLVGPIAFYGALIFLVITLSQRKRIPYWVGALLVVGIVAVTGQALIGNAVVTLVGFAIMTIGFVPVGRSVFENQ